jgi:hypothetical protein
MLTFVLVFSVLLFLLLAVLYVIFGPSETSDDIPQSFVGTNVTLTYDMVGHTIRAECIQVYDVPEHLEEEHIQHLLRAIESQTNEPYIAWVSGGSIIKRQPTYRISINGVEKTADYRTPAIDCSTYSGTVLMGGHAVRVDANGLIVGWAD